jgi:hypothetical protein
MNEFEILAVADPAPVEWTPSPEYLHRLFWSPSSCAALERVRLDRDIARLDVLVERLAAVRPPDKPTHRPAIWARPVSADEAAALFTAKARQGIE